MLSVQRATIELRATHVNSVQMGPILREAKYSSASLALQGLMQIIAYAV